MIDDELDLSGFDLRYRHDHTGTTAFLYKEVLELGLSWMNNVTRVKKPARLPTVLMREEMAPLLDYVDDGEVKLIGRLLYCSSLRLP